MFTPPSWRLQSRIPPLCCASFSSRTLSLMSLFQPTSRSTPLVKARQTVGTRRKARQHWPERALTSLLRENSIRRECKPAVYTCQDWVKASWLWYVFGMLCRRSLSLKAKQISLLKAVATFWAWTLLKHGTLIACKTGWLALGVSLEKKLLILRTRGNWLH